MVAPLYRHVEHILFHLEVPPAMPSARGGSTRLAVADGHVDVAEAGLATQASTVMRAPAQHLYRSEPRRYTLNRFIVDRFSDRTRGSVKRPAVEACMGHLRSTLSQGTGSRSRPAEARYGAPKVRRRTLRRERIREKSRCVIESRSRRCAQGGGVTHLVRDTLFVCVCGPWPCWLKSGAPLAQDCLSGPTPVQ